MNHLIWGVKILDSQIAENRLVRTGSQVFFFWGILAMTSRITMELCTYGCHCMDVLHVVPVSHMLVREMIPWIKLGYPVLEGKCLVTKVSKSPKGPWLILATYKSWDDPSSLSGRGWHLWPVTLPENYHDDRGKSPLLIGYIGDTSSTCCTSIVMLVFRACCFQSFFLDVHGNPRCPQVILQNCLML